MRPVVLVVRDGWGINVGPPRDPRERGDATLLADTPVARRLQRTAPTCLLTTHGTAVGLPEGQMGNSEVGHLNLGAGRVVYQQLSRIDRAIADGSFAANEVLAASMRRLDAGGRLHLMGLCSRGGVHSSLDHLFALLDLARRAGVREVLVHCFLDGRDTPPDSGVTFLRELTAEIERLGTARIATVVGRYYAMDRDENWERIALAYEALVRGGGEVVADPLAAVAASYAAGVSDEFVRPLVVRAAGEPARQGALRDGDSVIFFNFRADRARQLTRALTTDLAQAAGWAAAPRLHFACFSEYEDDFGLPVAFPTREVSATLAEVLAGSGLRQFHTAETEKYAHVTYFFNGGREEPFPGEERLLVPSPDVATYDLEPAMRAAAVTAAACERIRSGAFDFVLVNYANPDMVGHTGSLPAAIEAVEATDRGVGELIAATREAGGILLVTADHGNAEIMITDEGKPHTAHTCNPVELFLVATAEPGPGIRATGVLADVAPTVLELLAIPPPDAMTGESLLVAGRQPSRKPQATK